MPESKQWLTRFTKKRCPLHEHYGIDCEWYGPKNLIPEHLKRAHNATDNEVEGLTYKRPTTSKS